MENERIEQYPDRTPWQRFQSLARRLVAVPKTDVDELRKGQKPRARRDDKQKPRPT